MTLIVAYVDNDKGYIASDKLGSDGHYGAIYKNHKIFRKGNMLMGACGSYRQLQLIEHNFELPHRDKGQSTESYMCSSFINAWTEFVRETNTIKETEGLQESEGVWLFVIDRRIFKMQEDFSLLEPDVHFETIGDGDLFARAVLVTVGQFETSLEATDKIRMAVELTSDYIASVGGGIEIIST